VRSLVFLLFVGTGALAAADSPEISVEAFRARAAFLAHDLLEGRETGERGHELAALYAESVFRAAGFEPGNGDSFQQRISFRRARRLEASFAGGPPGNLAPFAWKEEFLIGPSTAHEAVDLTAPLVFAGYGMEAPELGRDDYAGLDARGRVVLLLSGAPASLPHTERAYHSSNRTKAEIAIRHGAVGVVTVRTRLDERRLPWARATLNVDQPALAWLGPDGRPHDAYPELRFRASLSHPAARRLLERGPLPLDVLLDAAERDDRTGLAPRELGLEVAVRVRHRHDSVTSPNVVAKLPGADPARAGEVVVVTAHLDHLGVGAAAPNGDTIYNGYFDNALGSALLLEIAGALPAGERPARTVLFVLVTGEERGLLGSDYFAHHPTVPSDAIVANVNFDAPLLSGRIVDLVAFGAEHSTLGEPARRAAEAHGFRLVPDPLPMEVFFVRSDQYSFVRRGVPAVYLDLGRYEPLPGGVDDETYLRQHYHRPSDDARLIVDWESARRFAATGLDLVRRVADLDERPRWLPGDFFGTRFGRAAGAASD
jgi:hypothetical protein